MQLSLYLLFFRCLSDWRRNSRRINISLRIRLKTLHLFIHR